MTVIKGIESGLGLEQAFADKTRGSKPANPGESFANYLGEMVSKVNDAQLNADQAIQKLQTGESKNLHEVMIAMEKSAISTQFLMQVRNKVVEAYQEVMRMPV
jgi:flagellar hook-basal body complex protein FliE